ncbi:MAG TPA: nucleoside triphosphate pyrophosphohydrolase [Vicinamibacterales bacterium]|nr:nucleoside triphosphate pyrophosphohydrolase [Vicinamibacterales bacterium]
MTDSAGARFDRLLGIMQTLRSPDGCPWDREQTLQTLRPFVLEETYELLDALDRNDLKALREELGDFLFEAVFLARIAEEDGHFTIGDSIQAITDKLIRRHPHVFTAEGQPLAHAGDAITSGTVKEKWEDIKAQERKTAKAPEKTILSGVPRTLPALLRAFELSTRAATVGFDWVKTDDVLAKIDEEVAELRAVVAEEQADPKRLEEEFGDLLFAVANLGRKMGLEPEAALRVANDKFQRRFDAVERRVTAQGQAVKDLSLSVLETHWEAVKADFKSESL